MPVPVLGNLPYFRFMQMANGEEGLGQLFLGELAKEIALFLIGIIACQEMVDHFAVYPQCCSFCNNVLWLQNQDYRLQQPSEMHQI